MFKNLHVPGTTVAGLLMVTLPALTIAQDPTDRFPRPTPLGVSISNTPSLPYIYAGTAGMRVRSFADPNKKFILSNNHVLGSVGPTLCPDTAAPGVWTLQPGTLDIGTDPGNSTFYRTGVFVKAVPLQTGTAAQNLVDAALSYTTTALTGTEILNIGSPTVGYMMPTVGEAVTKSGRTTGVTNGTVSTVNLTVRVNYGEGCNVYTFVKQIEITPGAFSSGGDSGSVILDTATRIPVGLLFAGSSSSTIGNNIIAVYKNLGVYVDGASAMTEQELSAFEKNAPVDAEQKRLEAIQSRHEKRLLALANVVGIGIGREGGKYHFRVFVKKATPETQAAVGRTLDGVSVVLVESGEFKAL